MKPQLHDRSQPKPDLLRLWMGAPEEQRASRPSLLRRALVVLASLGAVVGTIVLAKFAIDVLAILLALLVTGLVLHIVGSRVAQSTLLTPGTFAIVGAFVALFAYAFLAPEGDDLSLERYLPAPVVSFLTRAEGLGWAGRAFSGPSPSATTPSPTNVTPPSTDTPAAAPPAAAGSESAPGAIPPPSTAPVSISLSDPVSKAGQPVILMARLGEGTERDEVRFYDGTTLLGSSPVRAEQGARVAYLTVTKLSTGEHTLRAAIAGPWGLWSRRSSPVRHVVNP